MPYIVGLDLGRQSDYTALAALDQFSRPNPAEPLARENHYRLVGLQRWPLRTPYVTTPHTGEVGIVEGVGALISRPPLRECVLAIDQTGVGVAVVDFFRRANLPCWLRPITITGGAKVLEVPEESGFHVPKKELVSCLEVLVQHRRLTVVPGLQLADVLQAEFGNFNRKITRAGNETSGAWREGQHDDLVLAVALAAWLGENTPAGWDGTLGTAQGNARSVAARAPAGVFGSSDGWEDGGREHRVLWEGRR